MKKNRGIGAILKGSSVIKNMSKRIVHCAGRRNACAGIAKARNEGELCAGRDGGLYCIGQSASRRVSLNVIRRNHRQSRPLWYLSAGLCPLSLIMHRGEIVGKINIIRPRWRAY